MKDVGRVVPGVVIPTPARSTLRIKRIGTPWVWSLQRNSWLHLDHATSLDDTAWAATPAKQSSASHGASRTATTRSAR
jgi:hypothetical protein